MSSLGAVGQILNRINARTLQAIEASNGHIKLLNGHLKDFLLDGLFALDHDFRILRLVRQINEQVEMLIEYLWLREKPLLSP